MRNNLLFGHGIAFLTVFTWGTTFVSTKIILKDLSPVELLFFRFLIAYITLLIIYPKFHPYQSLKEEILFFALGLTGISLYFLVQNIALQYTLTSNVGLIVSAAPILTAILAHYLTSEEKLSKNLIIGFIIAISGIFLVIFNGRFILNINPLGDFLAFAAACFWAIYSVLLKRVNPNYNTIYIVRKTFFYGLLSSLPFLLIFKADLQTNNPIHWTLILNILFLGLAASSLCFIMWNKAIQIIGIVKTSNYIYLVPLITMLNSMLFLGETINGLMVLGGLLVLSGVYVSEKT